MNCVILQPSYLPWRGYFDQIRRADVFVFYDDVPYDARGWRNRNRVKAPGGSRWLTIPVRHKGTQPRLTPIHEIEICWDRDWARRHRTTIDHLYHSAPYYTRYAPTLDTYYASHPRRLADFTIELTCWLAAELGTGETRFLRSSAIDRPVARRTADLLAILRHVGADRYLSGPSARDYLDEAVLADAGIAVEYMRYEYPEYPQLHPPFDPRVTALDLLLMTGPDAPRYLDEAGA